MGNRTPIQVGKEIVYIGFVGVDRKTGEAITDVEPMPRDEGRDERTALFAAAFGLIRQA